MASRFRRSLGDPDKDICVKDVLDGWRSEESTRSPTGWLRARRDNRDETQEAIINPPALLEGLDILRAEIAECNVEAIEPTAFRAGNLPKDKPSGLFCFDFVAPETMPVGALDGLGCGGQLLGCAARSWG